MLKQVETVSYLVSIKKIRSEALKLKNDMGYSAADTVHGIPKDSKSLEIQVILMESGIKSGRKERIGVASEEVRSGKKWSWRNVYNRINQWFNYNGDWLEDMRGNLSLVATVISTITFQDALNPPGSVIQQDIRPSEPNSPSTSTSTSTTTLSDGPLGCLSSKDGRNNISVCPGRAILAYRDPENFTNFITYNTISFVASLCYVALLLVSGVPLKHRFVMWALSIGMGIALTCLLNAYFIGVNLVTPYTIETGKGVLIATSIFIGLYVLVGIYMMVIFLIWAPKKLMLKKLKAKLNNAFGSQVNTCMRC